MAGVLPYGDRALLIECDSTDEVLALDRALRAAEVPEVADIVPGARTVLLTLRGVGLQPAVQARLSTLAPAPDRPQSDAGEVVIDVVYDGADLTGVAGRLGLSTAEVIAAHTGTPWRAGFVGFAPGFAYLVGGDPRLRVPRHAEPRTRVPAGSVALAGEFSGIYPRESPGGWQLIGRTDAVLWDVHRDVPALLRPGTTVRFRALR